jgi:Methylamine utilisation protein MauE
MARAMGPALLVARVLLACVFFLAGVAKLGDLAGSRRAALDFGVPERFAGVVGVGLPVCEVLVAVALVPVGSARFGALGGLLLLGCFVAAIAGALARGRAPDCHCFGQVHSAPVGWRTLVRNAGLRGVQGLSRSRGGATPAIARHGG